MSTGRLLDRSANGAGRAIVAAQLARWRAAERKLALRAGPTVLHDFRVALRRLRSTLRAYRPYLVHPQGLRRRLRRLARSTNESRNLEVWRGWLSEQARGMTLRQAVGVKWLRARLAAEQRQANSYVRGRIKDWFPELRAELRQVTSHAPPNRPGAPKHRSGTALAKAIRSDTRVLLTQLESVVSMEDRFAAHRARIAAKRLRYLLEPFRDELRGAATVLRQIERLQDALGELHDAHVFADALRAALVEASQQRSRAASERVLPWPGPDETSGRPAPPGSRTGLLLLVRRLRMDGDGRFRELKTHWLSGGLDELRARLETLARHCASVNRGGRI